MRAAIYARFSSDQQNPRSIEDQVAVCQRLAETRGWMVVGAYMDAAISGAAMANRPGLNAALAAAKRGEFDVLLVEDEDRIARNLAHQAAIYNDLSDLGIAIATIGSEKIGLMEVGLKGMMAELYLTNLSHKTKRGMRSNAEKGLATGSRLYGYATTEGGAQVIVEAEADVIRDIARRFVAGDTPRQIAAALNAEGVAGPRGGAWNASTVNGSRQRGNGILHSAIYAGQKAWNRMEVRKDRATGRRTPKMRDPSEWKYTPVPHLQIIDDKTWGAIRARKAAEAHVAPESLRRHRGIFSGLLKCSCGASYTVYNHGRLICAAYRERGPAACSNKRLVHRDEIERRVLTGLREKLLAPDLVAAYVRTYHADWQARQASAEDRRRPLEKRLAEVERGIKRGVDAVFDGTATAGMKARLVELEGEKVGLEQALAAEAAEAASAPIELHPNAADLYRSRVAQIEAALDAASSSDSVHAADVVESVRGLVEKIEIKPRSQERGSPVDVTLYGRLAFFLHSGEHPRNESRSALVAGGGIEPPTCGL